MDNSVPSANPIDTTSTPVDANWLHAWLDVAHQERRQQTQYLADIRKHTGLMYTILLIQIIFGGIAAFVWIMESLF